ncbi:hypothetical protein GGS23DRAFT_292585 [Durotheca rogersii]|uniref:uncharacterized protein n=1 Tax=Durotheca rogersii TaxID=419775 RepID=UPI00221E50E0|nr:uncharacterized protein GGS23DRAFT_292585 [Durotheca rogersii]KAI5866863.1 hypothetical protein GGS23DRAFT_292585 [Durotheca rogersii]
MSDETPAQSAAAQPSEAAATTTAAAAAAAEEGVVLKPVASGPGAKSIDSDSTTEAAELKGDDLDEPTEPTEESTSTEKAVSSDTKPTEPDVEMANKPADETNLSTAGADNESKKAVEPASVEEEATTQAAEDAAEGTANETELPTSGDKSRARRKSAGDSKAKKLNKKASRVKILHVDAKPGDHYFAKLKGFPPWPVIIAEEGMLPQSMLGTRPVTAARPDGTYREDFADGGKRIADRTFPVMYLHTNEFSWTTNTDLSELDPTTVASLVTTKMRKDLQNAHLLAAEQNSLEYYKTVLQEFEEQRLAQAEADAAKKAKANKTPKKSSKAAETVTADEDDDIDMADVDDGDDVEQPAERKSKSKKRKADDNSVRELISAPQRSESVKKPKIKLTNLPSSKGANGVKSPTKDASPKPVKIKAKSGRSSKEKADNKEKEPKEPELSPEERHVRKEKEILFLRHRLQKGLLLRDQEPKEEEMKSMSEFLAKLETFPDLEVSVIRVTKINKVLKAILKLETIPKEGEFQFKPRSQTLLDKWNKILATDGAASAPTSANGVNGAPAGVAKDGKETTNGVKAEPDKADSKNDVADKEAKESEAKEDSASEDKPDAAESTKAPTDKVTAEVESTA